MTFDRSIAEHYKNGVVDADTAIAYASRRAVVGRLIDSIKASRGEKTTTIEGLSMEKEESFDDYIR